MAAPDASRSQCDAAAFEAVFRANYARLCSFVEGYVRSDEVANDLVQDLFVRLWERCEAGDPTPLTPAYLFAAARNRALKHIRHRKVVSRWADQVSLAPAPHGPQSDDEVRAHETAEAIRRAIHDLPERCREIFLMSRVDDLTYAAIAETLGISVKTVEAQMWRALRSLRTSLAPYLALVIARCGPDLLR